MTDTNEKIRALFLAAIMITSVTVIFIGFSGAATAVPINRGDSGGSTWETSTGSGPVGDGAVIFQGEDSITTITNGSATPNAASFERTAGGSEGETLQINPIPTDQPTGTYESQTEPGFTLTVQEPRVTTLEVQNNDGTDVAGSTLRTDQDNSVVLVEYNYEEAEDIELTVEDENGLDVTGEIVDGSATTRDGGTIAITPDNVDAGDYTFTVAGVEDLDQDDASDSTTVRHQQR